MNFQLYNKSPPREKLGFSRNKINCFPIRFPNQVSLRASHFVLNHTLLIVCPYLLLGFLSPAVCLLVASSTNNSSVVVASITLGVGLNGLCLSGFAVNHLDIAPPFASILLGITDVGATLAGIITPTLTGFIVRHHVSFISEIAYFTVTGANEAKVDLVLVTTLIPPLLCKSCCSYAN